MPTINQLVRKGRQSKETKSKSRHLNVGYNSLMKEETNFDNMEGRLNYATLRTCSKTRRFARSNL